MDFCVLDLFPKKAGFKKNGSEALRFATIFLENIYENDQKMALSRHFLVVFVNLLDGDAKKPNSRRLLPPFSTG
jgi:hypothetical protein